MNGRFLTMAEEIKPHLEAIRKIKEKYAMDRVDVQVCINGAAIEALKNQTRYQTLCFSGGPWESREEEVNEEY